MIRCIILVSKTVEKGMEALAQYNVVMVNFELIQSISRALFSIFKGKFQFSSIFFKISIYNKILFVDAFLAVDISKTKSQ